MVNNNLMHFWGLSQQAGKAATTGTILILAISIALSLYLKPDDFLAQSAHLGELVFEGPVDIKLPDGIPNIKEIRDFMVNITKRADYREPLDLYEESDVSRSEAASIAFELARRRDVPEPVLCDKYYRLFESDKHLTLGGVEELVGDARQFDEIEQPDANLAAHLSAENNYNSLKRLTLLHRVLIEEGIGVPSTLDIKVQKNLLQCIQYYKDRHERALDGLSDYMWAKREMTPRYNGNLNKLMEQFKYYMHVIADIEREIDEKAGQNDQVARAKLINDWLNRMAKMHKTIKLASPMIPNSVKKFIEHERRSIEFKNILLLMEQYERHKRRVLELEGDRNHLNDYRDALLALYEFAKPHENWLQEEYSFITEPRRDILILGHVFKLEHQNIELPTPKELITSDIEKAVERRMMLTQQKVELEQQQEEPETPEYPDLELDQLQKIQSSEVGIRSGGWGEKPYNLELDNKFVEERILEDYDITFYVKPDFEDKYKDDELIMILSDVVREVLTNLQSKCLIEKARRIPRVSCQKHQQIQQIINSN